MQESFKVKEALVKAKAGRERRVAAQGIGTAPGRVWALAGREARETKNELQQRRDDATARMRAREWGIYSVREEGDSVAHA